MSLKSKLNFIDTWNGKGLKINICYCSVSVFLKEKIY